MKCKTCGKNSDGEYCFQHKQRKPLAQSRLKPTVTPKKGVSDGKSLQKSSLLSQKLEKSPSKFLEMRQFFLSVWNKKPHRCENCDAYLGSEPLSYMFDHVLEKSKYPNLRYEEENICMLCLDCHSDKTNCKLSDFMKEKIKIVSKKFGI